MNNTRPILIGAVIIFIVVLLAGGFAYYRGKAAPSVTGAGVDRRGVDPQSLPAAIRGFSIVKGSFSVEGDNLGRVEIWMVKNGAEQLVGATKLTTPSPTGAGDIWTLAVPSGLKGASEIFARGYDKKGIATSKIDLSATDMAKL